VGRREGVGKGDGEKRKGEKEGQGKEGMEGRSPPQ